MRFKKTLASICFIVALGTAGNAQAQSATINGPMLGFTPDAAGAAIEPILGIPGASLLTNPVALGMDIRGAVVSPKQDYALAARAEDGQPVFIDLAGGTPITPIPGNHNRADIIAVSPTGSAAAIYDSGSSSLEIVGNLPKDPHIIHELNAAPISGRVSSVVLSDDGSVALVTFKESDRTSLWMMDSSGAVQRLPVDQAAGAAFFVNRNDAIFGDDANHAVFIITDAGRTAAPLPLVSDLEGMGSFSSIAASDDGSRVFLTDTNAGNVAIVDIETRTAALLSCGCQTTGLYRLKGNSVFRLNNASDQPMMVLDASGNEPRIVIVPPNTSALSEAAQ
jgi:hypothetical protein